MKENGEWTFKTWQEDKENEPLVPDGALFFFVHSRILTEQEINDLDVALRPFFVERQSNE